MEYVFLLLNKDIALSEGAVAFALLIGLQFAVTRNSVRVSWMRRLVTGAPQLLLCRGQALPAAMRQARVTEDEWRAAIRQVGLAKPSDAGAVVLETDGSSTVIPTAAWHGRSSLTTRGQVATAAQIQPTASASSFFFD